MLQHTRTLAIRLQVQPALQAIAAAAEHATRAGSRGGLMRSTHGVSSDSRPTGTQLHLLGGGIKARGRNLVSLSWAAGKPAGL